MSYDSNSSEQGQRPAVRVQINEIDHILQPPGPLDNARLPKVPVIRIFGPSSLGKKCCLHIHQVYPYFFVEYNGDMNGRQVRQYADRLHRALNQAIIVSLKRDIQSKAQYVRAVLLVKGIHFYGFHSSYAPFLKVYIIDPSMVNRTVTLLQSGTVMGTRFRVFESHLNFTLQFLSDFGLYGCGWINLGQAMKRGRDDDEDANESQFELSPHHRQSRMGLELDAHAFHILNRHTLAARNYHHELKIPSPPMPNEPFIPSVRELWEDERKRREARGLSSTPAMPVDPSATSRGKGADWVMEMRWWDSIRKKIEQERLDIQIDEPPGTWYRYTMSTFESVEALWEAELKVWRPERSDEPVVGKGVGTTVTESAEAPEGNIDIDVELASSQEISDRVRMEERAWDNVRDTHDPFDVDQRPGEDDAEGGRHDVVYVNSDDEDAVASAGDIDPFSGGGKFKGPLIYSEVHNVSRDQRSARAASPSHNKRSAVASSSTTEFVTREEPSSTQLTDQTFRLHSDVTLRSNKNSYVYAIPPPSTTELLESLDVYEIPFKIYRAPHYSNARDAPKRPREYGGRVFRLQGGQGIKNLEKWSNPLFGDPASGEDITGITGWEYASQPPSVREVKEWLKSEEGKSKKLPPNAANFRSQIEGPTQANIYNLVSTPISSSDTLRRHDMSVLSLEIFAPSRRMKLPDPEEDAIVALFYSFQSSEDSPRVEGIIVIESGYLDPNRIRNFKTEKVRDEIELLNTIIDTVVDLDPDILVGWEVQGSSWSYLAARGDTHGLNVTELIARATTVTSRTGPIQWETRKATTFKVIGRHVLNVWRIMRSELTLNVYSFEKVVFHVLRIRTPKYSAASLAEWYYSESPSKFDILFRYLKTRTSMVLDILNATDVVNKTAEFARVFGVDFYSVITRGSQFKVESFMFRIAKPESFVLLSPSKSDVGKQNAAECMPLIMEPQSAFYSSPVVVLDFQSLYPSIMIAYNYCYSTCLGRAVDFEGRNKLGVTDLGIPSGLLEKLKDHVEVSPNGMVYVKPSVRRGLLGRMLAELLDTRVMVKQAMKGAKDDKGLHKVLDARQLGLKYIANVTYGYTSATFSGRMPAVEIADSIVQSGRETLEKAIALVDSTPKWGAKVVYGDTDSMFIHLQGKTKEQAFRIGNDIADTITSMNPAPIKLKFEKVYLGCVLMAKKRYVGYKYENIDDTEPTFDAKGIETVRRDGIPAQQKMVENCLKLLFRTQDLSQVKAYCCRSWSKLLEGRASAEDFIFAKEVKMGVYSDHGPPPPGAVVAARRSLQDPRDEVQWGERVPYVIARGAQGARLVDKAISPLELLNNSRTALDADYYISRVLIPPLERIFNLVGANVRQWYDGMPRVKLVDRPSSPSKKKKPLNVELFNIDDHFSGVRCIMCSARAPDGVCRECRKDIKATLAGILTKSHVIEQQFLDTQRICMSCASLPSPNEIKCESLDCSWMFERRKAESKLETLAVLKEFVHDLEEDKEL